MPDVFSQKFDAANASLSNRETLFKKAEESLRTMRLNHFKNNKLKADNYADSLKSIQRANVSSNLERDNDFLVRTISLQLRLASEAVAWFDRKLDPVFFDKRVVRALRQKFVVNDTAVIGETVSRLLSFQEKLFDAKRGGCLGLFSRELSGLKRDLVLRQPRLNSIYSDWFDETAVTSRVIPAEEETAGLEETVL